MKRERRSPEQIIAIRQRAEMGEQSVATTCREQGIAAVTFSRGREKWSGMAVSEAARPRELERANARPTRLLAERDLELDATEELLAETLSG